MEDVKISVVSRFLLCAIERIRKDGNNGKFPIWLNPKLFYCSVFFETVDYDFCLAEHF